MNVLVEVLITASAIILNENEIIKDGYLYIKDGIVEDFGEGVPPEDFTYATLVLGGEGRIVAPGLTTIASPATYPFRFTKPSLKDRIDFHKTLSPSDLALLSLAGIYELHLSGITTVIVEGLGYHFIERIRDMAGGRYGLAYPSCAGKPPNAPEWSVGNVLLADKTCEGGVWDVFIEDEGKHITFNNEEVLALINNFSYNIYGIKNVIERSNALRRILGLGETSIKKNSVAEIVIFNVKKPPAMFLEKAPKDIMLNVYSSGARVESLMVDDEVIVDGGEHLFIVDKHFSDIRKIALRIKL